MFLVSACKWASRNLFGEGCVACVEFVGLCTILPSCFSLCWGRREQQVHGDAPGQKNKHFSEYHLLQGQHGALGLWPSRERLQLGGASWAPLVCLSRVLVHSGDTSGCPVCPQCCHRPLHNFTDAAIWNFSIWAAKYIRTALSLCSIFLSQFRALSLSCLVCTPNALNRKEERPIKWPINQYRKMSSRAHDL